MMRPIKFMIKHRIKKCATIIKKSKMNISTQSFEFWDFIDNLFILQRSLETCIQNKQKYVDLLQLNVSLEEFYAKLNLDIEQIFSKLE